MLFRQSTQKDKDATTAQNSNYQATTCVSVARISSSLEHKDESQAALRGLFHGRRAA